jgi:16S rRNA (cytosine1402-N4)-methyltransferase
MQTNTYAHVPVLLNEVMEYLDPKPGQNFVDATLGGGGYSRKILQKIGSEGKLLSIDLDLDSIETNRIRNSKFKIQNWILAHGNFKDINKIIEHHDFPGPDGIVADLGLSSYELDGAGRGISFQKKELLDMRFDQSSTGENAAYILNHFPEAEVYKILYEYGEDKFSRQIAKKIFEARYNKVEIKYTTDLYEIIKDALPKPVKHKADDSARRIFQALRIAVNHELENLETFLPRAFDILAPGGRLVVVTFHSLEDRIVKQFFVGLSKGCVCPIDFPQCVCGRNPKAKILTKKPITASEKELAENSRSKPAKLRAVVKL